MIRYRDLTDDTICAPVTASGHAGVSVIRISGDKALLLTKEITDLGKKTLESHKSWLTPIYDQSKNTIDQALVTYFEKGRSFTGDETVEISCHGNPLIVNNIVSLYLNRGCRTAERGEFSFRAYYNGKIDLVQAEAINDLVTSSTGKASGLFLDQLGGQLSDQYSQLESLLVKCLSHLEASIDFVEEDIETSDYDYIQSDLLKLEKKLSSLIDSYSLGKNLSRSSQILLLGETNVGKSSLFNSLIDSDRAIVTDQAGTTRDFVSEKTFLETASVEFIDSAGLRQTEDEIEKMGIERSLKLSEQADLVLRVMASDQLNEGSLVHKPSENTKVLYVINKVDLIEDRSQLFTTVNQWLLDDQELKEESFCFVSATTGEGVDELKKKVLQQILSDNDKDYSSIVTQARHFDHLSKVLGHINQAACLLSLQESPDILSQELQLALQELNLLVGKEYDDEILDHIFSSFCIGK